MSDDSTADVGELDAGAEAPSGASAESEAPPSAPAEYLDTDQYSGHHVRVRADGEDLDVPLSEVLAGYSRTADYTRKTQALAEQQRQAQFGLTLQEALENNPAATLRLLQEQYGVIEQPQEQDDDTSWLDDPQEAKLREYDDRLNTFEQWKADQELQVALRYLQQQYGDDFDPNEVVNRAMATGRMDLANIHKELMFDRFWATQQAQREADAQRQADDAKRTQAKAGLTPQMGGSAAGDLGQSESGSATSIADAWAQAKQKLGM
jgi:hypothetical protein